jgi:hypothetical protein
VYGIFISCFGGTLYCVEAKDHRYTCHCQHELCHSPPEVLPPPWLWVTNYLNCFRIILRGNLHCVLRYLPCMKLKVCVMNIIIWVRFFMYSLLHQVGNVSKYFPFLCVKFNSSKFHKWFCFNISKFWSSLTAASTFSVVHISRSNDLICLSL